MLEDLEEQFPGLITCSHDMRGHEIHSNENKEQRNTRLKERLFTFKAGDIQEHCYDKQKVRTDLEKIMNNNKEKSNLTLAIRNYLK